MTDPLLSRERAWALVTEHVQSESLRKHLLAVEAAVRGYARAAGEDEDAWGFVALVHDFDYEKFPDRENHPFRGVEILKGLGYPEWVTRAILSHADYSGVPRESSLEKTLFACDELSGFICADLRRFGSAQYLSSHAAGPPASRNASSAAEKSGM